MRKKSPAAVQKWVDSISEEEGEGSKVKESTEDTPNCDKDELRTDEPSTSETNENLKVKLNEICSNLKNKKLEFKNLIAKTTQKLKRELSEDQPMEHRNDEETNDTTKEITLPQIEETKEDESTLTVQRSHIGLLGRSSSENPNPNPIAKRNRRLNQIGRSFSVANENELPVDLDSSENLIYDADEDISITVPSMVTSPSNNTNISLSNSQIAPAKANLFPNRPLREHTVSEGHQSPQINVKNPLLRDSSFQVGWKSSNGASPTTCQNELTNFSFQSDSSHCSSVESLLEARKPDAEAILINLGFGPVRGTDDVVSKIPKRYENLSVMS